MSRTKSTGISIELNPAQVALFEAWQKSFGELPYIGFTGGHFGISVIFTSIGEVIEGIAWNGEKIELTEVDGLPKKEGKPIGLKRF